MTNLQISSADVADPFKPSTIVQQHASDVLLLSLVKDNFCENNFPRRNRFLARDSGESYAFPHGFIVAQRSNCGFRATHNAVSHELRGILMIVISSYGDDLEDKMSQDRPLAIIIPLFNFQKELLGQSLLEVVFARLNLLETAYFGLRYLDFEGQTVR